MAPQLDRLREAELFWMSVRFQLLYRFAVTELGLGYRPLNALVRLADMVGDLGSALEKAAAVLAENSAAGRPPVLIS